MAKKIIWGFIYIFSAVMLSWIALSILNVWCRDMFNVPILDWNYFAILIKSGHQSTFLSAARARPTRAEFCQDGKLHNFSR